MFPKPLEVVCIEAHDPRSDDGRRIVEVSRDCLIIKRIVSRAAMSIRVGLSSFRGLKTHFIAGKKFDRYELWLTHDDPDLALLLAVRDDRRAIEAQRLEWSHFLCLVARDEDRAEEDRAEHETLTPLLHSTAQLPWPQPRARGLLTAARRPRFLARRKVGSAKPPPPIHPRRRILFDGSRPER